MRHAILTVVDKTDNSVVVGDQSGQVRIIAAEVLPYIDTSLRVVRTRGPITEFVIPIPVIPIVDRPEHVTVDKYEHVAINRIRFRSKPKLVLKCGYGPLTQTWVVMENDDDKTDQAQTPL